MIYTINSSEVYSLIDEEVSRVAAVEYNDEGKSLYDAIVLHSGDKAEIDRLQADAVNNLVVRLYDITTILPDDGDGHHRLEFDVPDLDTTKTELIKEELTRYIVLNTCAAWLQTRTEKRGSEYTGRAQASIDKASSYLHTRRKPSRI